MSVKEIEWQFNARIEKTCQAVECLADIRWPRGRGSVFLVFDSEQLNGESEQVKEHPFSCSSGPRPGLCVSGPSHAKPVYFLSIMAAPIHPVEGPIEVSLCFHTRSS